VTAHRRLWTGRSRGRRSLSGLLGVLLAGLATTVTLSVATPAFASTSQPAVMVTPGGSFKQGTTHNITVKVTSTAVAPSDGPLPADALTARLVIQKSDNNPSSDFTVTALSGCTSVAGDTCSFSEPDPGNSVMLTFKVVAAATFPDVPAGQSVPFVASTVTMTDTVGGGFSSFDTPFTVTAVGPPAPPASVTITGAVFDVTTGLGVASAAVKMRDSTNQQFDATTDSKGSFTIVTHTPIQPGPLSFAAAKDTDYKPSAAVMVNLPVGAATLTKVRINLTPVIAPSASASSPLPSDSALSPSDPAASDTTGSSDGVTDPGTTVNSSPASGGSNGNFFNMVLIAGLVLIVGGGIAFAIVLIRRRREEAGGDDDYDDDDPRGNGGGGGGGYRGPDPGMRPGLADQPTMMHSRAPVDEFPPDPYGVPRGMPAGPAFRGPAPREPYPDYAPVTTAFGPERGPGGPRPSYPGEPAYDNGYPPPNRPYSGAGFPGPGGPQGYPPPPPPPPPPVHGYDNNPGYASGPAYGSSPGYGGPAGAHGYQEDQGYQAAPPPYRGAPPGSHSVPSYDQGPPAHSGGYDQPGQHSNGAYDQGGYPPPAGYGPGAGYDQGAPAYGQGYGEPAAPAGYGAYPGGQPAHGQPDPGYDQGYGAANGYPDQGYDQAGYADRAGYAADQGSGYAAGNGYTGGAAGYPGQPGYDQAGYDQAGYDQGYGDQGYGAEANQVYPPDPGYPADPGYGAEPGYDQSYDQGYGDQGGYDANYPSRGAAPQAPGYRGGYIPPAERGSVDWLDD
jgi:hypothetical protein